MTNKQLENYIRKTKFDVQRANAAFLFVDLVYNSYANFHVFSNLSGGPVLCRISHDLNNLFYQIISKKNIERVAEKIYFDYHKDPRSIDKKINEHINLEKELDKIWKNYKKIDKNKLTNKELISFYGQIVNVSREWWEYTFIGEDKGKVIETKIIPKFAKRHNMEIAKAQEIVNTLSHPKEQTILNLARKDFLTICQYVLNSNKLKNNLENKNFVVLLKDKKLFELLNKYIKDYFWIKSDFYRAKIISPRLLLFDIAKEISITNKNKINKDLIETESNFNKIEKAKRRILLKIKLSKEDKKDIKFAEKTIFWIEQRKLGMMKDIYYLFFIIDEIAKRFNIKFKDIAWYTYDDFERLITKNKKLTTGELKKRNQGVFLVFEKKKKTKIFYGQEGKEIFDIFLSLQTEEKLRGVVASVGGLEKISGQVSIVYDPQKNNFEKGNILVTSMTRVEFVPLMRKAKAIITNEGGIACHAAIVSRELNIPCIIGTKVATDRLKDGDKVGLDLKNGEIKLL